MKKFKKSLPKCLRFCFYFAKYYKFSKFFQTKFFPWLSLWCSILGISNFIIFLIEFFKFFCWDEKKIRVQKKIKHALTSINSKNGTACRGIRIYLWFVIWQLCCFFVLLFDFERFYLNLFFLRDFCFNFYFEFIIHIWNAVTFAIEGDTERSERAMHIFKN